MRKEKLKEKENKMKKILLSVLPMIMLFIGCDIDPLSWTNDSQFDPHYDNNNDNHYDYNNDSNISHTETITETFINGHGNWAVNGTIKNTETDPSKIIKGFQVYVDFYTDTTFSQFCTTSSEYCGQYPYTWIHPGETANWTIPTYGGECNTDDFPNFGVTNIRVYIED